VFLEKITPSGSNGLKNLDPDDLKAAVMETGCVQMNGFIYTDHELSELVKSVAPGVKRGVVAAETGLLMHGELYWTPYPPDILWFICITPPEVGGETLLVDGIEIATNLSKRTFDYFCKNPLIYERHMSREVWQRQFRCETVKDVKMRVAPYCNCLITEDTNESIILHLSHYAIRHTKWGGEPAFVNSLLHALDSKKNKDLVNYGLCNNVPEDCVSEVQKLVSELQSPIIWSEGDIVVIDNTRMMHGRNPFSGKREINAINGIAAF